MDSAKFFIHESSVSNISVRSIGEETSENFSLKKNGISLGNIFEESKEEGNEEKTREYGNKIDEISIFNKYEKDKQDNKRATNKMRNVTQVSVLDKEIIEMNENENSTFLSDTWHSLTVGRQVRFLFLLSTFLLSLSSLSLSSLLL